MKFGIAIPIIRDVEPHVTIEIAKKAEELGYDSIWVSDHVVVPDKYVGRFSRVFYDPFVLLTAIAAHTNKIKLGTSVIILPYRNPIVVAKMIATLDVLSEGRVIFGVGAGWMKEEFDVLGIPFDERGRRTDEYIRILKELWEEDEPRFEGKFFRFSDIKFYPKPLQKPHPPIWIGGGSRRAIRRAALLGDGWQPTWVDPEAMEAGIDYIKDIAKEAGRELSSFIFSVRTRLRIYKEDKNQIREEAEESGHPFPLYGTSKEIINRIQRFKEIGVSHIVIDVRAKTDEEMFYMMERFSKEIMPIIPSFPL
jgi:probable F420-dependent oxidoreductase